MCLESHQIVKYDIALRYIRVSVRITDIFLIIIYGLAETTLNQILQVSTSQNSQHWMWFWFIILIVANDRTLYNVPNLGWLHTEIIKVIIIGLVEMFTSFGSIMFSNQTKLEFIVILITNINSEAEYRVSVKLLWNVKLDITF